MIYKMFTVYDTAAKAYLPPFILPHTGQAVRMFTECCNSKTHQFGKFPADYTLFLIARFDDSTANLDLHTPEKIHNGLEVLDPDKFDEDIMYAHGPVEENETN